MNRKIEARHERIMQRQQEKLFAKAAFELGNDEGTFGTTTFGTEERYGSGGGSSGGSGDGHQPGDQVHRRPAGVQEQVAFADLKLSPLSTIYDVRKKFKQLALKYHPDRSTNDTTNVFRRVLAAREVLEAWFEGE